jgi:hypothetical protein
MEQKTKTLMHKKSVRIKFFFLVFFLCLFLISFDSVEAKPLVGWLWGGSNDEANNTGVGWISVNSDTPDAGGGNYQLDLPSENGSVERYVWSSNIGWIDFQPGGSPPYGGSAGVSLSQNYLQGWARVMGIAGQAILNNSDGWDGWIYFPPGNNVVSGSGNIDEGADTVIVSGKDIIFSKSSGGSSATVTINNAEISISGGGSVGAEINCVKTSGDRMIFANSTQSDCTPNPGTIEVPVIFAGAVVGGGANTFEFFKEFSGQNNIIKLKRPGIEANISVTPNAGVKTAYYQSGNRFNWGFSGYAWSGEFSSPLTGLGWILFDPSRVNVPAPIVSLSADPPWILIGPDEQVPINNRVKLTWSASPETGGFIDYCTKSGPDLAWTGNSSDSGSGLLVDLSGAINNFQFQCWNGNSYAIGSANVDVLCNQRYCENNKCVTESVAVESWDELDADGNRKCFENCTNDLQCQNFEWREKAPN